MIQNEKKTDSRWLAGFVCRDSILGISITAAALFFLFYLIPAQVAESGFSSTSITPAFFPNFIAGSLGILGIALVFFGRKTSSHVSRIEDKLFSRTLILWILLSVGALFSIEWLGMIPIACITMFVTMRMFGFQNAKKAALISVIFVFVLFVFFEKGANVSIPRGTLIGDWY